jgi:phosphoenolpyruvate synthase/pyruvate phosphate dikinase/glycerol-3-phosphate acyltransferase PlsY
MTIVQVGGLLAILLVCPCLGGLPLIDWITYALTGKQLNKLGTGNVSVSAAFYHGGRWVGILAVVSEASKGIAAVLLSRAFFPAHSAWELIALIALVMGRYWMGKGAGVTNVFWGIIVHDSIAAGLVLLIGGISFTIFRERKTGRIGILVLLALILSLRHPQETEYITVAIALSGLLFWIYQKIPDDLELSPAEGNQDSQKMFRFFRGNAQILSLEHQLSSQKVGQKAARLSQLKHWGYPVPEGWILPAGDDPEPLVKFLEPSNERPLVVRSSAIGEDSESASAAGQYRSLLNVTTREALTVAILECQASYSEAAAITYRQSRQQSDQKMAVLVQRQIKGVVSGVAFSRNPIDRLDESVLIEALPGSAESVVSGKVTPFRYRVYLTANSKPKLTNLSDRNLLSDYRIEIISEENSNDPVLETTIETELSSGLIESIAVLAREIEALYRGMPQDIEWTYDGEQLWLLQTRPVTTLHPIWTRKIAAEVIPGTIRPLTWSINQPLTCGVWGEIFKIVLGEGARDLDFDRTATLHHSHAYFNASLLGEIFLRMGLPPESLEFLTRGEKFSKPSLKTTLKNIPGLLRLLGREWKLEKDFQSDRHQIFAPIMQEIETLSNSQASPSEILERIELILLALNKATYYSILVPLSVALRRAILKVEETELDNTQIPEIACLRSLATLAADTRKVIAKEEITLNSSASLFAHLAEIPEGENILEQFNRWLEKYGYLSEAATDIAIPRWQENPRPAREMFTQLFFDRDRAKEFINSKKEDSKNWRAILVQKRLNLKGQVTETYEKLLAHLRWSFLELEKNWLDLGWLSTSGDIFFLEFTEVRSAIRNPHLKLEREFTQPIQARQAQLESDRTIRNMPYVLYGNPQRVALPITRDLRSSGRTLTGIGASSGRVEGIVKVVLNWQDTSQIDRQTILVVTHTDAGWSPLLARSGGIIAEVGGRLSHGAIIAREYEIPAVMDVHNATQLLKDGQRVRIDGESGVVNVLD